MSIFYSLGNALVSNDELRAKEAQGVLGKFMAKKVSRLDFMYGTVTHNNLLRSSMKKAGDAPIDFVPIGIGIPLTVHLRHVYTGNKAHGFWGDKDMLVSSAMKSIATYDAAPRAINFLVNKTKNNRNFRGVPATDPGTPLIFYSPALAQDSSVVTVEVMFDNFPKETFEAISQAFSSAASIPVFAPASGVLFAAGILTKLIGQVGKSLSNGTPILKQSEEITFVTPGSLTSRAGFCLMIADDVQQRVLAEYKVGNTGMLVKISNEKIPYDGPEPYVVISIDGRPNDGYKDFTSTAASSAILDRFYNINDGGSKPLGQLVEGLKLYNDMKFRDKANLIAAKVKGISDQSSQEYKDLLIQHKAYLGNITNETLKPSPLT